MIKIGEFSKLARVTIKTLRYYDEIGLFKPKMVEENGYRYYDEIQLKELLTILELRSLDMSIEDIKAIITNKNNLEIYSAHLIKLEKDKKKLEENIYLLKSYIERYKKGDFMENYNAKLITLPDFNVYYRHGTISSIDKMFEFILQTGAEAQKNNPTLKCLNYCFVTYTAKEYREKDVEIEYLEAVDGKVNESENIKSKIVKGGKFISVYHKGLYANLNKAYAYALNYVKDNNFEIIGDIREVYIDGCWNKDNEKDYLTEIQIPIK